MLEISIAFITFSKLDMSYSVVFTGPLLYFSNIKYYFNILYKYNEMSTDTDKNESYACSPQKLKYILNIRKFRTLQEHYLTSLIYHDIYCYVYFHIRYI